ncbi:MAG: cell division protein ZapD [Gammaproteobacteria bacterium]|nr:cell division protein ZapD [Gammaproteobacteria bacterium]
MAEASSNVSESNPERRLTAFEQPLNERMRTFLRLEFLHQQAWRHAGNETEHGARAAIASLLEILAIAGRGDVRADALKELDRQTLRLNHYQRTPGVDAERLAKLMAEVDSIRANLSSAGKQFLAKLRDNEFLNAIRHRSAIPGGTCMFDLPDYGYWLRQPRSERTRQLSEWLTELRPLCDAIDEVLWLTREANTPIEITAVGGLYNHSLGKEDHFDLVRVLIPRDTGLFPEISAGQHRFTVRFAEWQGTQQRPSQVAEDVRFLLALC